MKDSCKEFIETLLEYSGGMQEIYRKTVDYWSPDEPPVTTLFAAIGDQIVEYFWATGNDVKHEVFQLIEGAMNSDDDQLVTAVATGLIEAMVSIASQQEQLLQQVLPMFGMRSRNHADAWLAE